MERGQPPRGLLCPGCGSGLEPLDEVAGDEHRLRCSHCRETFRARRRESSDEIPTARSNIEPPPAGSFSLFWRGVALRWLENTYWAGVLAGSAGLIALGGFLPVIRGWLRDEVRDWGGVLEILGGVHVITETRDPDADLGPVLARSDAPLLFTAMDEVARRLGVKPPGQVRLTYLPCCGVVAWERSRALILGLPLLRVLTMAEIRAILAHELAHLARGDATRAARSVRFVEGLRQALDQSAGQEHGPLGFLARTCFRWSSRLIGPIARGQETRADRSAAAIAGGSAAASALVKVALVQPLFREVLEHYNPDDPEAPNLYAFFRAFWYRLPAEVHTAMRLQVLTDGGAHDPAHPPLPDRLALLQSYPDPASVTGDTIPATSYVGDLETLEQMLHNRLFGLPAVEPSVFHKTRV
ncbi:M48 family metallopeptidase [Singulisphaera acidiphila]|uniref:Zn-dependent protease with chaperone function n=1 Tax=Singulisphaera acidiphila (strain ATCC BAA-1392 / DSM 18658 / VKM B-2454 / MOB10) TaxID=886293 RepID=L0DDU0_SINAD|nr:M48 family metallopeptidase [Singulisphaera acidiphila]AGA27544.1 Zn-dependent protease with chaperone function [Singulisphaera acidiphila DSM 18658]